MFPSNVYLYGNNLIRKQGTSHREYMQMTKKAKTQGLCLHRMGKTQLGKNIIFHLYADESIPKEKLLLQIFMIWSFSVESKKKKVQVSWAVPNSIMLFSNEGRSELH